MTDQRAKVGLPALPIPLPHGPASPFNPYNSQGGDPNPASIQEIRARKLAEALKRGSRGGFDSGDLNAAISGGTMAIPVPGVGVGAGAVKGIIQELQGRTYNQNPMSFGNRLVHGPGIGEQIVTGIGNGIHDLTHPGDLSYPRHSQVQNQPVQGGYPPIIPPIRPRAKPPEQPPIRPLPRPQPPLSDEDVLRILRQRQDEMWGAPTS